MHHNIYRKCERLGAIAFFPAQNCQWNGDAEKLVVIKDSSEQAGIVCMAEKLPERQEDFRDKKPSDLCGVFPWRNCFKAAGILHGGKLSQTSHVYELNG